MCNVGESSRQKSEDSSDQDLEATGNMWLKSSKEFKNSSLGLMPSLKESIKEKDEFSKDSLEAVSKAAESYSVTELRWS